MLGSSCAPVFRDKRQKRCERSEETAELCSSVWKCGLNHLRLPAARTWHRATGGPSGPHREREVLAPQSQWTRETLPLTSAAFYSYIQLLPAQPLPVSYAARLLDFSARANTLRTSLKNVFILPSGILYLGIWIKGSRNQANYWDVYF